MVDIKPLYSAHFCGVLPTEFLLALLQPPKSMLYSPHNLKYRSRHAPSGLNFEYVNKQNRIASANDSFLHYEPGNRVGNYR